MNKTFQITLVTGIATLAIGMFFLTLSHVREKQFLQTLKGEIVFLRRDGEYLNIYKVSARGEAAVLLFHNDEQTPFKDTGSINQNSLYPRWGTNGAIRFIASRGIISQDMNTGGWKMMEMNTDGSNARIIGDGDSATEDFSSMPSRSEDIIIQNGDVYYRNEQEQLSRIYNFRGYAPDINSGASEASWSPDKQYIIFGACPWFRSCGIYIANRSGTRLTRITSGTDPDWKY